MFLLSIPNFNSPIPSALSGIKPDSCFTFDNTPAANSPDAPYVPVNKSNISSALAYASDPGVNQSPLLSMRSEERRVGKECRARWWTSHCIKKDEGKTDH